MTPNRLFALLYAYSRHFRIAGAIVVVLVLAFLMAGTGLYFLMRGEAIENSILNERIEAGIQSLIGPDYKLDIGKSTIGFDPDGLLSFSSSNVKVVRAADSQPVSGLGRIIVGVEPWSFITGSPRINAVIVEDSTLDIELLALPLAGEIPSSIKDLLSLMSEQLENAHQQFRDAGFRLIQLRNTRFSGLKLGRPADRDIFVDQFELRRRGSKAVSLDANLHTNQSDIKLTGTYASEDGKASSLGLAMEGLQLGEWVGTPEGDEGQFGSDANLAITADFPFTNDDQQPAIKIVADASGLRIGKRAVTDIKQLELNIRLMPGREQIELDPSVLVAGDFNARLIGGVRPADESAGYRGDLIFELIMDPARRLPTVNGEESISGSMRFKGRYASAEHLLNIDDILALVGDDRVTGSANIGLARPTPSFEGAFRSDGIEMAAVKQFWPFFIASPAREWIHRHVVGGRFSNVDLNLAVPAGVLGRFREGAKMEPDEFLLTADFEGVRTDTFGELPPVSDVSGSVKMKGMNLDIDFASGRAIVPNGEPVRLDHGSFSISDVGEYPNPATVSVTLTGDTKSVSILSDFKPLNVFRNLSLDPLLVSGGADVDVVAKFPIKKGLTKNEVDWHAIVSLDNSGSKQSIFGHRIGKADIVLDATASSVRIVGNATVDGTRTKLDLTEPLGGSDVASSRSFSTVLDNEARAKIGLSLDTILDGPIAVSVRQLSDKVQRQRIDLKDANLSLPWIGWQKGKSIPAVATFDMHQSSKRTTLENFYIEGEGFSAAGTLTFDKSGIVSADFADISLNKGDSFALKLARKGKLYDITVSGARIDARGLINKLVHIGGFGEDQGTTDVRLNGNLGSVRGFNGRTLNNVTISYGTADGWFDNLSFRGTFAEKSYVNVFATTNGEITTFNVDSTNAGSSLAFVDVYRRMTGGDLRASLTRKRGGPFVGPVRATSFIVTNEPRLQSIITDPARATAQRERGSQAIQEKLAVVDTKRARFLEARAQIEKGNKSLTIKDGVLTGAQIGFTFDGTLFDAENRMDLTGTFLPAMAISRAIGLIPIVGDILGNGRDTGLIGVTFRMSGPSRNPKLEINPISVVAPGVFRKVFEFRN